MGSTFDDRMRELAEENKRLKAIKEDLTNRCVKVNEELNEALVRERQRDYAWIIAIWPLSAPTDFGKTALEGGPEWAADVLKEQRQLQEGQHKAELDTLRAERDRAQAEIQAARDYAKTTKEMAESAERALAAANRRIESVRLLVDKGASDTFYSDVWNVLYGAAPESAQPEEPKPIQTVPELLRTLSDAGFGLKLAPTAGPRTGAGDAGANPGLWDALHALGLRAILRLRGFHRLRRERLLRH